MEAVRKYGNKPFQVAILHGGPGGPGQVAPIARELSLTKGILEPLQSKYSIDGQLSELHDTLKRDALSPITLIGHSWGAMLAILYASQNPEMIKKLILVSCGPLESKYSSDDVMKNRFSRMSDEVKSRLEQILKKLETAKDKNSLFSEVCDIATKIDSYSPILNENELIEAQYDVFTSVWGEVENFRSKGGFEKAVKKIKCSVVAIHGDYDPHPSDGVKNILSALGDFTFYLLDVCGHYPWLEKHAKEKFYSILKKEIDL